jgi:hypothetical protein
MKEKTKALAIAALQMLRSSAANAASSAGHSIDYKRSVVARAASAGAKTRATNDLKALEIELEMMKVELADAEDAIADMEAMMNHTAEEDAVLASAMIHAEDLKRKAEKIACVVSALRLALCELDMLRPLHYGQQDRHDRPVVKLGAAAEHFVKEELACLPLAIEALKREFRGVTDEQETACAKVRELDPVKP